MDEEEMLEMFMECDDLVLLGIKDNKLILWHSPDSNEIDILDMLLYAYRRFYETAQDNRPLH